jgi:hypothetical protein
MINNIMGSISQTRCDKTMIENENKSLATPQVLHSKQNDSIIELSHQNIKNF